MSARDVYLVGSIPLTRPYNVFATVAEILGDRIRRVPDGETGDRAMWVQGQYSFLATCPALEVGPFPEDGLSRVTGYQIPLRLKDDTKPADIVFPEIGYARHAIASYGIFESMRQAGRLPGNWRFQVCVPAPMDVMTLVDPPARPAVEAAWEKALLAELAEIQAAIPHDRLAVSIDVVQGMLLWEYPDNYYVKPYFSDADGFRPEILDRFARLADAIEPKAEVGFHLCYGSQDHKHAIDPGDAGAMTSIANALTGAIDRRIDYWHMPVPRDRTDEDYFAPLAGLDLAKGSKVYLGLIHYTDGVDGTRQRIAAAEPYLADFGIATECGFGRRPSEQDIRTLLAIHADAAD